MKYSISVAAMLYLAISSASAAIVEWRAEDVLPDSFRTCDDECAGGPGIFEAGDPVSAVFRIANNATPVEMTATFYRYQSTDFVVQIGDFTFGADDGIAILDVTNEASFQILFRFDPDIPKPGYWIQQVGFGFTDRCCGPNPGIGIPTMVPDLPKTGLSPLFDADIHQPDGYQLVIFSEIASVSIIPIPAVGGLMAFALLTCVRRSQLVRSTN